MSKRKFEEQDGEAQKRPKADGGEKHRVKDNDPTLVIHNARQLAHSLMFQQDAIPQLRNGIKAFKVLLEPIAYAQDKTSTGRQQNILRDFLQSQIPSDSQQPFLPSLFQAWDFGLQTHNDGLVSAVSSILALLLKSLSSHVEFTDLGSRLCRTCLEQDQAKLIASSLSVQKQKDHIISPALRLMTELISFDGGLFAKQMFLARKYFLDVKSLHRALSMWRGTPSESGSKEKPTVRSNAVKYLLSHLKFQSASTRAELMRIPLISRGLFENMKHDVDHSLRDTVKTVNHFVLDEVDFPRSAIPFIFTEQNMISIASAVRAEDAAEDPVNDDSSRELLQGLLLKLCTDSKVGLIRKSTGYYPPGTEGRDGSDQSAETSIDMESFGWHKRFESHIPVRNSIIGGLLQTLRPFSSNFDKSLCVNIFTAVPELQADFFVRKAGYTLDPKLTSTWIGIASLVFETVSLNPPAYFGAGDHFAPLPPPISIVLDNILPPSVTQKILSRCLNQQQDMITYFTIRLLVVALRKARKCLDMFRNAAVEYGSLWESAQDLLVQKLLSRLPLMKDIVATYRKTPQENHLQREAVLRLLELIYEVLPSLALQEKLDLSVPLTEALQAFEESRDETTSSSDASTADFKELELAHLLQISRSAPDTRWFHTPDRLKHSPFATILQKAKAGSKKGRRNKEAASLAESILKGDGILLSSHTTDASPFMASVEQLDTHVNHAELFDTINDLCTRCTRRPIKYEDDLDDICKSSEYSSQNISLLWLVIREQWPFIANRATDPGAFALWSSVYATCSVIAGEDQILITTVVNEMKGLNAGAFESSFKSVFGPELSKVLRCSMSEQDNTEKSIKAALSPDRENSAIEKVHHYESSTPSEEAYHKALHRTLNKPPAEALADGSIQQLILCLSSQYPEVRNLALQNLQSFLSTLLQPSTESSVADAKQLYLLIGVLANTISVSSLDEPAPWLLTTYAATAVSILQDPLHPLYEKCARFHTRAPTINARHLPTNWIARIVRSPPTSYNAPSTTLDAAARGTGSNSTTDEIATAALATPFGANDHLNELHFLLAWLYAGTRLPADVAILRSSGALEPVMALACDAWVPAALKQLVLRLVWRITAIDGGSDTLITRRGCFAWIGMVRDRAAEETARRDVKKEGQLLEQVALEALARRLWDTCDQERITAWSGGAIKDGLGW